MLISHSHDIRVIFLSLLPLETCISLKIQKTISVKSKYIYIYIRVSRLCRDTFLPQHSLESLVSSEIYIAYLCQKEPCDVKSTETI